MEKISAVMIDSTRYQYNFNENYVSTFGNGELAAHVALTTLEIIEEEKLDRCALKSGIFCKGFYRQYRFGILLLLKIFRGRD